MQSAWLCVSMGDGERDVMKATASETTAEAGWSKGPYRAPRGPEISCKGWQQEAAMRMLLNNLDPEVAEKPEDLVGYGGGGRGGGDGGGVFPLVGVAWGGVSGAKRAAYSGASPARG